MNNIFKSINFIPLLLIVLLIKAPINVNAQTCGGSYTSTGLYDCVQGSDRLYRCTTSGSERSGCGYSSFFGDCRASVWAPENCDLSSDRTSCADHNKIDGTTTNGCSISNPPTSTPNPSAPPPPPGTCGGGSNPQCVSGSDCGVVGKVPGSGSCSGGQLCCVDGGGGGGGGGSCDVDDLRPRTVQVGQVLRVTLEAKNNRSSWHNSEIQFEDIDTGAANKIWVTNTSGQMNSAIADPAYVQRSETKQNICCGQGGSGSRETWTFWIRGMQVGADNVNIEFLISENDPGTDKDRCSGRFTIRVVPPPPWVQVSDGSLITLGRITNPVPPGNFLINSQTSDEGIVTYNPTLSISGGNVSRSGWNVNNSAISQSMSYADLVDKIPSNAIVVNANGSLNQSSLTSGVRDSQGYEWYQYTGNTVISSDIVIPAGRKIVVFVDGPVQINSTITMTSPLNSFFMIVSTGNIDVSPPVGGAPDNTNRHLEGVFVTDSQFVTSTGASPDSSRVNIRGSVMALNGVSLARDARSINPSESFVFAPEFMLNFPPSLSVKRAFWREVTP